MRFIAALLLIGFSITTSAHHSRAEFSEEVEEITGELVSVNWTNPHPTFTVNVRTNGEEEQWDILAYDSLYGLTRAGVTLEHFTIGEHVRLLGQRSNRTENFFLVSNMLLSDRTELIFYRRTEPYWEDTAVGGEEDWAARASFVVDAAAEDRGIFRLWSLAHALARTGDIPPLTPEASAIRASWDASQDTSLVCVPKGMPRTMGTPDPYEFTDNGETITIIGHEFRTVRTIHMTAAGNPRDQPASHMGYSVGHWEENDKVLVVETSRINWPWFQGGGYPQTEAVTVVERFTLSDDQTRLDYHAIVTDPATFTGPATLRNQWLALGEIAEPYECSPDD